MPRGQKSKLRRREKRHQVRDDFQGPGETQATETVEDKTPSSSSPVPEDISQSSSALESSSAPQEPCRMPSKTTASTDVFDTRSNEGDNSQDEQHQSSSEFPPSTEDDSLAEKVFLLEQFLLNKYKMKQPITKEDMLQIVDQEYEDQFDEILKRASNRIQVVFAVDVTEIDSTCHLYNLVSKLKLPNNGRVRAGKGMPKTGLLMTLLGVIFTKGNCATEEEIWNFLKMMQIYPGKKHYIYGEPRKLITQDFVRLEYLVYQQVPNSQPPSYEFLWGPKAYTETTKMKVLEFLAGINGTVPSAFSEQYEEALRDEEERARAGATARPGSSAITRHVPWPLPATSPTPIEV